MSCMSCMSCLYRVKVLVLTILASYVLSIRPIPNLQYHSPLGATRFPSSLLWPNPPTADITDVHTEGLHRSYFCKKERDFHFFVIPVTIIPESSFTHLVLNMQALPEGSRDCMSHKKKKRQSVERSYECMTPAGMNLNLTWLHWFSFERRVFHQAVVSQT